MGYWLAERTSAIHEWNECMELKAAEGMSCLWLMNLWINEDSSPVASAAMMGMEFDLLLFLARRAGYGLQRSHCSAQERRREETNQTECLSLNQTTPFAEETRQIESCFWLDWLIKLLSLPLSLGGLRAGLPAIAPHKRDKQEEKKAAEMGMKLMESIVENWWN